MSAHSGPNIIEDNLLLHLDAANRRSYPGSGTIWRDLSGNRNNGILTNGPTFSLQNGGVFTFDGSNDYIYLPPNFINWDTGNPFAISVWFKTASPGVILGQENNNWPGSGWGWVPSIYIDANGKIATSCFWGNSTSNVSTSSFSVNNNLWNNITVSFQSNTQTSYFNGVSYASLSKTQASYSGTYYYFLGAGKASAWPAAPENIFFNGGISSFICYNRALSAKEIAQNFNALRGRFGI